LLVCAGALLSTLSPVSAGAASDDSPNAKSSGQVLLPSSDLTGSVSLAPAAAPQGHWTVASYGRVTAHLYQFDTGMQIDAAQATSVAADWSKSLDDVLVALSTPDVLPGLRVDGYLYPDAPSFMLSTGDTRAIEGLAIPWTRQFYVIDRADAVVTVKHELTHIVSYSLFGSAGAASLDEGLAVALAGWSTANLDEQVSVFRKEGELMPLSSVVPRFASMPGAVAYPEMGSFVRFLIRQRGMATLAKLYSSSDPVSEMPRLYGVSLPREEQAWLQTLPA